MATQTILNGAKEVHGHSQLPTASVSSIHLPTGFRIQPQDERLKYSSKPAELLVAPEAAPSTTIPPLSVLSNFSGTFMGTGFSESAPSPKDCAVLGIVFISDPSPPVNANGEPLDTIFRPNNGTKSNTTFPKAVSPAPPAVPNDNTLELNLTHETLAFAQPLGNVPNRGFGTQGDIFLNGVPYTQTINDVANPATGLANGTPSGIHFEPGLWMHVPATTTDPVVPESLNRMGSIPHGTTVSSPDTL